MSTTSKTETIAAWLETIVADNRIGEGAPTLLPPSESRQPFLTSFQSFGTKGSAAPIEVGDTMAEGGMGIIRIAEQEALGRTVVVKTLRAGYAPDAAEHVLREAWATGALEHPNIVPIHDIRRDQDGLPMIVLKRIEGDTWLRLMHDSELIRERFGATSVLDWNTDILRQVTQAVRFAHSRGILHRDLKPENVMIGSFGEVYLVDWGIALCLDNADVSRLPAAADAEEMAGTPCYMAPEMLGGKALDERTDIYLLGAMLFEILAGRPPHSLNSLEELMEDIRKSEPSIPEKACPLLSAICLQAMRKEPADRYVDASEFAQALSDNRKHRDSAAIAEVAHERLLVLESHLTSKEEIAGRHDVYNLFGAVRLGFGEALKDWPENESAQQDLDRAVTLLIEYELQHHNPVAAQTFYKELSSPNEALESRIDDAVQVKNSDRAELRKFRNDGDESIGRRTRLLVMIVLGVVWTVAPLARYLTHSEENQMSYNANALGTAGLMLFNLLLWPFVRKQLSQTKIDRQLTRSLFSVFPLQILMMLGAGMLDLPLENSGVLMLFLWLAVSTNVVVTLDARFWPIVAGYLVAFIVATRYVDLRFFAIAGGNFVLLCTSIHVWYQRPSVDSETSSLEVKA